MEGIRLIDASEVHVKKKTSKIEIKKIPKIPINIIDDKNITESVGIRESDKGSEVDDKNILKKESDQNNKSVQDNVGMEIRAIKLKQEIYYGPKNVNKNKFMRLYKKLGLTWLEDISIGGMIVSGWVNKDRSQYIIKLLEEGDYKRFKFYGCDAIYDYFMSLGAVTFDYTKETQISPSYQTKTIVDIDKTIDKYEFIGADLWSGYMTRKLLKNMPDNWGVIWK